MHLWIDLLAREGGFLLLLGLLGAGPAAFLSERFDPAARIALAPLLGFCVGMAVTTTLIQFWPANSTHWILVPLVLASVSLAIWRRRSTRARRGRIRLTDGLQLAVVCLAVAGPLTYALHQRHTVGPADYYYTDGDAYVAETDGEMTTSAGDASSAWTRAARTQIPFPNLTQYNWAFRANFPQQFDASALEANVNGVIGVGATATWDPFLIAILLTGGLGAFAVVRYATESSSWVAALGGALFGGPALLELYYDTYQAAVCGLALVIPLVALWYEAFRTRRKADLVLCALVLSGFLNVYPLFIPLVGLAAVVVLAWLALRIVRDHGELAPHVRSIGLRLLALAALAIVLQPVAFVRDVDYAKGIVNNTIPLPRVGYHLPLDVIPGWLLQTRGFWQMATGVGSSVKQFVLGGLLPLGFLAVIAYGLWRFRRALALVVLAAVCLLVAEYSFASRQSCTYCAQRNLLPLTPIAIVLLALGVYALATSRRRAGPWLAAAAALMIVAAVGERTRVEFARYANSSYFLDTGNRVLLSKVPRDSGTVVLEGYDGTLQSQAEEALVYSLTNERIGNRISLVTSIVYGPGLSYLTFNQPTGPWPPFDPDYGYVLTRFGAVSTGRTVIARHGPFVLEARSRPLDVFAVSGLQTPLARIDPTGTPWVQPPTGMVFYVTGPTAARRVWAHLLFDVREPVTAPRQAGVTTALRGHILSACVAALGHSPLRTAMLTLSAAPVGGPVPGGLFPPQPPLEGIALIGMHAVTGSCSP